MRSVVPRCCRDSPLRDGHRDAMVCVCRKQWDAYAICRALSHGWSFANGTGVFSCPAKGCEGHRYRETIKMGATAQSQDQVESLLPQWYGHEYDLLTRNCCHFSDTFVQALRLGPLPPRIMKLAQAGACIGKGGRDCGVPMIVIVGTDIFPKEIRKDFCTNYTSK